MRASELSIDQAHKLKDQLAIKLRYFNRLVERMTHRGFSPTDPLYAAAIRARAAVQDLHVQSHYAGCKHGVAKAADNWPDHIVRRA